MIRALKGVQSEYVAGETADEVMDLVYTASLMMDIKERERLLQHCVTPIFTGIPKPLEKIKGSMLCANLLVQLLDAISQGKTLPPDPEPEKDVAEDETDVPGAEDDKQVTFGEEAVSVDELRNVEDGIMDKEPAVEGEVDSPETKIEGGEGATDIVYAVPEEKEANADVDIMELDDKPEIIPEDPIEIEIGDKAQTVYGPAEVVEIRDDGMFVLKATKFFATLYLQREAIKKVGAKLLSKDWGTLTVTQKLLKLSDYLEQLANELGLTSYTWKERRLISKARHNFRGRKGLIVIASTEATNPSDEDPYANLPELAEMTINAPRPPRDAAGGGGFGGDKKPDWLCECGTSNFARRFECFKCKTAKPENAPDAPEGGGTS